MLRIVLGSDQRPPRVVPRPVTSAMNLFMDFIASQAMPSEAHRRLTEGMSRALRQALLPSVVQGEVTLSPSWLTPVVDNGPRWVAEWADRVADTPNDGLADFLAQFWQSDVPARWRPAARNPSRWINVVASGIRESAPLLESIWSASTARVEVETYLLERDLAERNETIDTVAALSRPFHKVGNEIQIPHSVEVTLTTTANPLEITPVVGTSGWILNGTTMRLGYVMRASLADLSSAPVAKDYVAAVLGGPRAQVLRRLDTPMTLAELADALVLANSSAHNHVFALRAANLVTVTRVGTQSWITRTDTGRRLLNVLDSV